jgi:ATP phosphoribosyltransferase
MRQVVGLGGAQRRTPAMITLALSKGRIFDDSMPLLRAAGIEVLEDPEKSRKLIIGTTRPDVRVVLVRASDVPTYVEHGGADIGVAGLDVLLEHAAEAGAISGVSLYRPLDLKIARCRLSVAVRQDFDYAAAVKQGSRIRVADRPGRCHRRSGQHRQHAQGQPLAGGGARDGHQLAFGRQPGCPEAQA